MRLWTKKIFRITQLFDSVKLIGLAIVFSILFSFCPCFAGTYKDISGDLNNSFSVNLEDLAIFFEQWLEPFGCAGYEGNCADIYGEDGVNVRDLAIIASNWQRTEIPLFINEVLASNLQTEPSNAGFYDDWIEIYNASDQAINLAGMYLTDSSDTPTEWQFPVDRPLETTVDPNGFVFVWADGTLTPPESGLHASFKLGSNGDDVWLYDTDGQTVIDSLVFGEQTTDVSFGREPDASAVPKTLSPTPGSSNNGAFLGLVDDTKFSRDRGFYTSGFDLDITCATPGAEIYYTLNGSEPAASSTAYVGPITISSTTCVRAIAIKAGYKSSNIDTHTYIFVSDVLTQSAGGEKPSPEWPNPGTSVNGQLIDYGMDTNVVNDSGYGPLVDDALLAIPSLSIVTDLNNLFHVGTGIYVNALNYGPSWERPASFELINPDGSKGFQVDAGLRIRGGWSRKDECPKHSFRLFFRAEYGDSKLEYDLFEGEKSANKYDKIDLRTAQNYSWSFNGDASNTFMRDVFSRDLQHQMGQPYTRSRFYHLYIDGQYWGIYQTQERSEAAYGESYFGGDRADYDVVKADAGLLGTKMAEATDGTLEEFGNLWDIANQFDNANLAGKGVLYNQMLGLNPDGSSNPNYPVYLDPDNLIDLMLNVYYVGEKDGPISNFFGNNQLNNFYGIFNRNNPDGFKYFRHDAEHSLEKGLSDRTGPYTVIDEKVNASHFNPQTLHQWLMEYPDYRMHFVDRAYKHMFNNGVMTEAAVKAQYDSRAAEIDMAIIAESARWGDAKTEPPRTKAHWITAVANARAFLNNRVNTLIGHLRNKNWYPLIDPAIFYINGALQYDGSVSTGDSLTMTNPNASGIVYYTTDGSDPRLSGGSINPTAQVYPAGETMSINIVSNGSVWKYLYDGSDQGTAWKSLAFNDAAWGTGPGQLGFGDGDEDTDIGPKVDGRRSAYFRHVFNVSNISNITELSIDLLYDDGAVIYINEQEIAPRINMLDGTIAFDTLASNVVVDDAATTIAGINPAVLLEGDNILAVEVHQVNDDSSDISFELSFNGIATSEVTEVILDKSVCVKARVLDGSEWSALADTVFGVGPVAENLRITELMYHPADPNTEFIELQNIGTESINLNLVEFAEGVDFVFGEISLDPDEYMLIVQNLTEFEAAYDTTGLKIAGQYIGSLENAGEKLELKDAASQVIHLFDYKDGWYELTDGMGFSLTVIDPTDTDPNMYGDKDTWRASTNKGGSPGTDDISPNPGDIVINELLAHSHADDPDWIELHNTTDDPINIGGWFLSDNNNDDPNIMKFEIPLKTIIPANGYIVFYEDTSFGDPTDPGCNVPFAFSEAGETAYLHSGLNGVITGYVEEENFDASESGVAFGRYYKASTDTYNFVAMSTNTPETANAYPKVGPIVISEIMYNPLAGGIYDHDEYEFVELYNITDTDVTLQYHDVLLGIDVPWKFTNGIDYTFPLGTMIPGGGRLVIARNIAAFTQRYGSISNVTGPYAGQLSNGGEKVDLSIPGDEEDGVRYYIRMDRVNYSDGSHPVGDDPWPVSADGAGDSLNRIDDELYGNDYINWQAVSPSPGL